MKSIAKASLAVVLSFVCIISLFACKETYSAKQLWENATYKSDKVFGTGAITVQVEVIVEENSATFTINTDKVYLGEALLEHGLISGEVSKFGMYIKSVNGILADYNIDQSYWGFYKNGEYMLLGVDSTTISNGEHYELIYKK